MRKFFIGFEFTHDKQRPQVILGEQATRVGPVKRWVDAGTPHMVKGKLRERVALVLPSGFRFRKDEIKNYLRQYNTWTDAKFAVAMTHALGKYLPYATKTHTPKQISGLVEPDTSGQDDGAVPGNETPAAAPVQAAAVESKTVEGSQKAG